MFLERAQETAAACAWTAKKTTGPSSLVQAKASLQPSASRPE